MDHEHVLIVGAGPAGSSAARTLREQGYDGRITMVGADFHHPYLRPALSKQYLRGEVDQESLLLDPAGWYDDNDVTVRVGSWVSDLDPARRTVRVDHRDQLRYDALLLATGSTPRRLALDGAGFSGVHSLRTLDDASVLQRLLAGGNRRVVLIGSGWIGMEVAASARRLGNSVTILERDPVPLAAALGEEVGSFFLDLHTRNGVTIRRSVEVEGITGTGGIADGVRLSGGEIVDADVIVIAVGVVPNLALATEAGAEVDHGVLVDDALRTSVDGIWAAGDIANLLHPLAGVRIRSEHFSNAMRGGAVAAESMLGRDTRYDDPPTFFSSQFDVTVQFVGYAPLMAGADLVLRGRPEEGSFTACWLAGNRLIAAASINAPDEHGALKTLVREGRPVDPTRLASPAEPAEVR